MNKLLSGKKILITGGTSELGRAFVQKAIAAGAEVYFTFYQNREIAQQLEDVGAKPYALDLRNVPEMDALAKKAKEEWKTLDALIHNAAAVRDHTLQNMSEEDWDEVMQVDLKAPYYLTKKLLPLLFKNSETAKKILMIISRVAVTGGFGVSNYAAAKAGLIGLAKSLAQELGKKNILVNAVNPGFMKSRMTVGLPEHVIEKNIEASPLRRFSSPDEVADFLVYLCSDQMTQVTGQVLHFESRKI